MAAVLAPALPAEPFPPTIALPTLLPQLGGDGSTGFVAQGVPESDLERYLELLEDPDTIVGSPVLMTAWGRKRATS